MLLFHVGSTERGQNIKQDSDMNSCEDVTLEEKNLNDVKREVDPIATVIVKSEVPDSNYCYETKETISCVIKSDIKVENEEIPKTALSETKDEVKNIEQTEVSEGGGPMLPTAVEPLRGGGKKMLSCNICNKSITRKYLLERHMRIHTGEKPFTCDVCQRVFTLKQALVTHFRTHTGERPHTCGVCGKTFAKKQVLTVHSRTHTGEKPFRCKVCNKAFSKETVLKTHYSVHSDDKPYCCNVCNKYFSVKHYLTRHLETHNSNKEKSFTCGLCNKTFRLKRYLMQHFNTHKTKP